MGAAQLEVAAAEVTLLTGPGMHVCVFVAMELHTELVVAIVAAPILLFSRPSLHPVAGTSVAIVAAVAHVHLLVDHHRVMVPVAMPAARAAQALVVTAPTLLAI